MAKNINPIPLLAVLFLLQKSSTNTQGGLRLKPPALHSLELESMLDSAHSMIHIVEKLNNFAQAGGTSALPDMKKMMEIVEKLPL